MNSVSSSFVIFGEEWGAHPSSTQHLARHLAAGNSLLYVNGPGMRPPRLSFYDARRAAHKLRLAMRLRAPVSDAVLGPRRVYTAFAIPTGGFAPVRILNRYLLTRGVRRSMSATGIERPILLVSNPTGAEVVGHLGEQLLVYYVTDEYSELPGVYRRYVRDLERILMARADIVFATSEMLCSAKHGAGGTPSVLLPHGVDFEHWNVQPHGTRLPPEIASLPRPRLGFFGLLAPWVDDDILLGLAKAFPHGSIVLIGPRWSDYRVPAAPNIAWLGARSYAELPCYASHFDVGLVPFRRQALVAAVNPLKVLEYLALGIPVVSTPVALPSDIAQVVHTADASMFNAAVKQALADNTDEARRRRTMLAARESWSARVTTVREHIDAALARKGSFVALARRKEAKAKGRTSLGIPKLP